MKKRVLSCFMVVVMIFGLVGCKDKYTADNFTEEHTFFNVTYYVPESDTEVERSSNGFLYTTKWGKITLVAENTKEWDNNRVIEEQKKKSTRRNFDSIKVDGEPALYYEYEDNGKKGIVVHFNTNRSGCAIDISSNDSVEQAKAQFKEFISKVKIDNEKDKAIDYSQKQTIDNITYYLPENSTKSEDSKDDGEEYYVDGGMISIKKNKYIEPKMLHNENFIQTVKSSLGENGAFGTRDEKKTINDKPVLCIRTEYKKDSENTSYQNIFYICSNQNLVIFNIFSCSLYDALQKYDEFLEKLSIDNTPYLKSAGGKTTISDFTKKVTIDNVTFYVPENSTEKEGKGSTKYYYYKEDGSFIMTEIGDYSGEESWQSEKYIESYLSGLGGSIQIKSYSKITINNSPALAIEGEIKENGYTGYVQSLAFSSNKHNITIGVMSLDSAEDAKNKIDDVKQKIRIDKTQPYPTGSNKVIYSDSKVKVSFVEFDSIGKYSGPRIKLLVENKSGKTLLIQSRSESVNGFMVDTICSFTVSPGNKAYDYITITKSSLEKNNMSVSDISKIEFKLCIVDDDHWTDSYETKKITINI